MTGGKVDWVGVGRRLRRIRRESGLSQREFGRQFGVSQNMISLYEKGRSRASVDFYARATEFGNKTIEWLLAGCEDRAAETLREMRDLHDKMSRHLGVVRQLLDRETEHTVDSSLLTVDSPTVLREMLAEETDLPRGLRQAVESAALWNELSMNGREAWAFRIIARVFGSMGIEELRAFLELVRRAGKAATGEDRDLELEEAQNRPRPDKPPDIHGVDMG